MSVQRRQHNHGGMSGMSGMGGMNMPTYTDIQHYFWIFTGSVLALVTLINIVNFILFRQRISSLSARPRTILATSYATVTAITRELSHASLPVFRFRRIKIRTPQLGPSFLVLAWLTAILVFCFYGYDTFNARQFEDIAYRVGNLAIAELPLVFLLAGKQNLIGLVIGSSYERLNWLHRWVARIFWITVTIHMSFWFRSWARYNYILRKMEIDYLTQTGFACWCILTAIVVSSFLPIRKLSHEVFYILHIILFAGLMGAIYLHISDSSVIYFWISVAIFFLDRFARIAGTAWANLPFLHGKGQAWANTATLTPLPGNITRLSIPQPVVSWSPGQHMFVSCHALAPLQAHPFTASTLPSDGKLEFLIQAHKGGTRRFHRWASKNHLPPQVNTSISSNVQTKHVALEGPYGRHRPLQQFDSVLLFAGSTGATFTVPLMRDIVQRWVHGEAVVTRCVKFVWVVKARDRMCWFEDVLERALQDVSQLRSRDGREVKLDVDVYVTCDEDLDATAPSQNSRCQPREHGDAEMTTGYSVEASGLLEKQKEVGNNGNETAVRRISTSSSSSSSSSEKHGCAPDGGCCCKDAAPEEGDADAAPVACCCGPASLSSALIQTPSTSSSSDAEKKPPKQSLIKIHTGRPRIRAITRSILEDAEGESAVVSCGPQGLQDDVRRSVNALSDERAVHKGTGAQGVYLLLEGFGY